MQTDNNKQPDDDQRHEYIPGVQEKSTLGGAFNSGVTSEDAEEKDHIEKQGSLAILKTKPKEAQADNEGTE